MPILLDLVYLAALVILSPWLTWRAVRTGRYRQGWAARLLGRVDYQRPADGAPLVWFHAVSVGEVHLLRPLLAAWRARHPGWHAVVSASTDTGLAEARRCFPDLPIIGWPFDFSWAVRTALTRVRPELLVLAEGELWPNMLRAAHRQGVRTAVVNARMSPRSARRYLQAGALVGRFLCDVDLVAAQSIEHARHYQALGARKVVSTGNIKYDGVQLDRHNPRTAELVSLLNLHPDETVWVCGSTQDPEERLALDIYRRARRQYPGLRLILVPRHPERFDEVARLLAASGVPYVRRSACTTGNTVPDDAVILIDTMGELGAIWGRADIAFVGGSLDGRRGGQNMIEPAAYGAAVLLGPHTWNFKQTVEQLLAHEAALQVADGVELEHGVLMLLADEARRSQLGQAAHAFVRSQQGATRATVEQLESLLRHHARQVA